MSEEATTEKSEKHSWKILNVILAHVEGTEHIKLTYRTSVS